MSSSSLNLNQSSESTSQPNITSHKQSFNLTTEEESCLKSALAFVVLRRRRVFSASSQNKQNEIRTNKPIFNGVLVPRKKRRILPSSDTHIQSMLRVSLSMAFLLYSPTRNIYDYTACSSPTNSQYSILDGLASHVSCHLRSIVSSSTKAFPSQDEKYDKRVYDLLKEFIDLGTNCKAVWGVCTVLHRLVYFDGTIGTEVMGVLCREIRYLYEGVDSINEESNLGDIKAVSYLHLLEGIAKLRLLCGDAETTDIIKEMQNELGEITILPIELRDMASYFNSQRRLCAGKQHCLDIGARIMLRLFLFDIVKGLSFWESEKNVKS